MQTAALAILLAGCALGVLADQRGILTAEAALRSLRASQMLFGVAPSIESLGFELPPLATLLQVPLVLLPPFRSSALPGSIIASGALATAAWALLGSLRGFGLGWKLAGLLVCAVVLHPLVLYATATGAGDVLGLALLLVGLRLVLAWVRESNSIALVGGAFAFGLAGLARYDLLAMSAALTFVIARLAGSAPGQRTAFAIAFGTPAAATLGLWLVLNGLATSNPLTFAARAASALAPPPASLHTQAGSSFPPVLLMAPATVPAAIGAAAVCARFARRARVVLVVLVASLAALIAPVVGAALREVPLTLMDGLPLVALSVLLMGALATQAEDLGRWAPVTVGVALASAVAAVGPMATRVESGAGYGAFMMTLAGGSPAPMWSAERELASTIRQASTGRDVLVDDRRDPLPVLLTGEPSHFFAAADPDYAVVRSDPLGQVRLILVHAPGDEDGLYGNASSSELLGDWPISGDPTGHYRLYRVTAA
jgi:hypothetical protein